MALSRMDLTAKAAARLRNVGEHMKHNSQPYATLACRCTAHRAMCRPASDQPAPFSRIARRSSGQRALCASRGDRYIGARNAGVGRHGGAGDFLAAGQARRGRPAARARRGDRADRARVRQGLGDEARPARARGRDRDRLDRLARPRPRARRRRPAARPDRRDLRAGVLGQDHAHAALHRRGAEGRRHLRLRRRRARARPGLRAGSSASTSTSS